MLPYVRLRCTHVSYVPVFAEGYGLRDRLLLPLGLRLRGWAPHGGAKTL